MSSKHYFHVKEEMLNAELVAKLIRWWTAKLCNILLVCQAEEPEEGSNTERGHLPDDQPG